MAIVRRVGPGSAFKVGLVLYALIGLVLGICMAFISMVAGTLGSMGQSAAPGARLFGFGMGFGAIIFFPLVYGLIGESSPPLAQPSIIRPPAGLAASRLTSTETVRRVQCKFHPVV
jgi:hypothetical protein